MLYRGGSFSLGPGMKMQSCSHPTSNMKHKQERNLCWGCLLQQHDLEKKLTDTQCLAQSRGLVNLCGINEHTGIPLPDQLLQHFGFVWV